MTPPLTFTTGRDLNAPPDAVFTALSNPAIIANWWGPLGFTTSSTEFNFTPGGRWWHEMRGPDGTLYPNLCIFEEISPNRIVIRHLEPVHEFVLILTIEPTDCGSHITWSQTFLTSSEYDKAASYVPQCNEQNLDRLELELAVIAPAPLDLVLRRIINAPADKVFRAWTDPAWIVKWFTPPPYKTLSAELDVRPGGSSLITMGAPDGTEIPNPGVYLEVIPNRRLVMTDAYTRAWKPSPKPFCTIELDFEDLGGRTKYTAIVHHWTPEDHAAHRDMGFQSGWSTATDQLEALVTSGS